MTRETNVSDLEDASRVLPRQDETPERIRNGSTDSLHDGADDEEESDGDFELETMEDDDEDDEFDDEGDDDDDEAFDEDEEAIVDDALNPDESMDTLDDELMALVADATTGSGSRDDNSDSDDRIAHRTRTKLSLVDVEIDLLESLLPPDPVETSRLFGNDGHEYQRFLSSLLPRVDEEDNLSFLDEEDEEYHPEEDEDDDDDMDDDDDEMLAATTTTAMTSSTRDGDGAGRSGTRVKDYALHHQSVRVSKKELTELLWDSTQLTQPLKVPPTFPKTSAVRAQAKIHGTSAGNRATATQGTGDETSAQTVEDLKDAAALKEMKGTISQQQCIQLASQMHKHFQLLLQSYYLITTELNNSTSPSTTRRHKGDKNDDQEASAAVVDNAAKATAQEQLEECESMLRELQVRGKHALKHKAQLLSKLTLNSSSSSGGSSGSSATGGGGAMVTEDLLEKRRVTRSITAAHAAVAHPSMFDIVGSQSIDQLTATFRRGCSISERNQGLRSSMLELDKHLLLNRKKHKRTRSTGTRKIVFSAAEDRLLLRGVKRHGGINAEAWREIRETLIPTKDESEIAKRYRYLCSRKKRGGGGAATAFKEYHSEHHKRKWAKWMIEEDVRVARGVVEYFGDNRRYARISSKYLPHRHRLEIRKRWERLKKRYQAEVGCESEQQLIETPLVVATAVRDDDEVGESHDENREQQEEVGDGEVRGDDLLAKKAAARAFATAVKRFLEMKLRESVKKMQQQQLVSGAASVVQATASKAPRGSKVKTNPKSTDTPVDSTAAQPRPGVTGNGDTQTTLPSQSTDATLEASGCGRQHLHPALFFSSWAVINPAMLLQHTCAHNWPAFIDNKRQDINSESTLDMVSRAAVSRVEEETAAHRAHWASQQQLHSIEEEKEEGDQDHVRDEVADFSLDAFNSDEDEDDEDEDEEDSDFERDELLSSDAEDEDEDSDSEYEQLELYDDEDDTGDDDDDGDDEEEDGDSDQRTGRLKPVQPTLHLNSLRQPGNNPRATRALEALERRITGNTQTRSSDGFGAAISSSGLPVALGDGDSAAAEAFPDDVAFDDGGNLDLFAYEELSDEDQGDGDAIDDNEDDENDDGFEQDELHTSDSSGASEEDDDDGDTLGGRGEQATQATGTERSKRIRDGHVAHPEKRAKLPRCGDCGSSPCVCATPRMQRLLQRIQHHGHGDIVSDIRGSPAIEPRKKMGNETSSVELEAAAAALAETSGEEGSYSYHNEKGEHVLDDAVAEFCGFRVLGIQEESPASRVGFVSFFDFILAANGIRLDTRDSTFMELIAQSEEKPMQLDVYNLKSQSIRNLTLTPSRQWAGKGLLGVTIRFDSYENAEDQLLHVLDVTPQSPAFDAGLRAGSDYLLGTPERVFRDTDDLQDEILDALDDALQCYVYNSNEDQVRIVRISPSEKWGGAGVLGAEVGHGVLHRLPEACRATVGTSIGFVSLSEEAKAATDPYLRQIPADDRTRTEELSQSPHVVHETSDDSQSGHDDDHVSVSVDAGDGERSLSPNQEEQDSSSQATAPPLTADLATGPPSETGTGPRVVLPVSASPFIAAYSPDPQAAAKPRYAARIDPQFPISTVAVLADPTQLG